MPKGVVKKWFPERGFGFATPNKGGPDVFLHVSELHPRGDADLLLAGTEIRWESVVSTDRGPKALAVTLRGVKAKRPNAPEKSRRTDQQLAGDLQSVLLQLRIGRFAGHWGYSNLNAILEKVDKITSQANDKTVFLPSLQYARDRLRGHIEDRWIELMGVQARRESPNRRTQEWGKLQDVIESGDQVVVRVLRHITGAVADPVDDAYEPASDWPIMANRGASKSKKRWWQRGGS